MKISETHEIYTIDDFTPEEKYGQLAVAVAKGHVICKKCGDHDHQLVAICTASKESADLTPEEREQNEMARHNGTVLNNNETLEPVEKRKVNINKYSDGERLEAIGKYGLSLSCDERLVDGKWIPTWRCQYGMTDDDVICGNSIRGVIDYAIDANQKAINE